MSAYHIYDNAPLGSLARYSDGTSKPPARFNRKLREMTVPKSFEAQRTGSDSDTSSEDDKTIETRRPQLLQCASVIPRRATQRHDAKGGSVATRSVFPSLHREARVGMG